MRIRKTRAKVSDELVITAYQSGMSTVQIAQCFSISASGAWKILKINEIPIRPGYPIKGEMNKKRLFPDKQEIQICKEYKNGLTGRELAQKYNVSNNTIFHALERHGYKSRGLACTGKYSSRWRGGISYDEKGYKRLYLPKYKWTNKGGLVKEHRFIMQEFLGRKLNPDEVVHHINGVKDDNRIENLRLMHVSEHNKFHNS